MRILIATDAWHPQINGVVRTLTTVADAAKSLGVDISFLTPQSFPTVALPGYSDLRLALPSPGKISRLIEEADPDNIHIATEGPIGLLVRRYCRKRGLPFTTSFHTRFPEYISARLPIPESWVWAALRRFHRASRATMAATPALADELRGRGFHNVVLWSRGVDTVLFRPHVANLDLPRPKEPQLLTYAAALNRAAGSGGGAPADLVDGVYFAGLRRDAVGPAGFGRRQHFSKGASKLKTSWSDQVREWTGALEEIAGEFCQGTAALIPAKECRYCAVKPICRVQGGLQAGEEEEDV